MAPFSAMLFSGPISSSSSPSSSSFGMVLAFFLSLALCSFLVEYEHVLRNSTCEVYEPLCRNIQVVGRFVSFGLAVDRAHMAAQEPRILPFFEGIGAGAQVGLDLTWLYDECVPEVSHGCECPNSVQPMTRSWVRQKAR